MPSRQSPISASPFANVGLRFLGTRLFRGKCNHIELYDLALVDKPAAFQQIVDAINRSEQLRSEQDRLSDFSFSLPCDLTDCHIWVHYQKHCAPIKLYLAVDAKPETA